MIRAVFVFTFLLLADLASATTYYVGKSGSNANSCATAQSSTAGNRKLTIAAGLSCASAGNGDIVIVGDGTYVEGLTQANFVRGTSWTNALTLKAENRYGAIIKPGSSSQAAFDLDTAATPLQYVIIDGFDIDGSTLPNTGPPVYPRGLIKIWGDCTEGWVNHIRFQYTKMHGYVSTGNNGSTFVTAGDGGCNPNTTALEVLYSEIYSNGTDSQFSNAFYIQTGGNLFQGNSCHDNIGDCFRLSQQNAGWPQDNIVVKNLCHDNTRSCAGMNGDHSRNNLIANNIFYNLSGDACIDGSESGPINNTVVYNTCYNALYGVRFSGSGNVTKYNIFRSTGTATVELGTNTFSNNITADPLFVSTVTPDFHIQSGSPAIGAGAAVAGVTDDYDSVARPQGSNYDAGAYQYLAPGGGGGSSGGMSETPSWSSPRRHPLWR